MEELEAIIEKMKSNGESQETIDLVVNEYKKRNPNVDFQTPTAPGAVVEETVAPDMESKSEAGSLESQPKELKNYIDELAELSKKSKSQEEETAIEKTFGKNVVTNFFGDLSRAWSGGKKQGLTLDNTLEIYKDNTTDEEIKAFLQDTRKMAEAPQTDEMIKFSQDYEKKKERMSGVEAFFSAWWDNPTVMAQYSLQSMGMMVGSLQSSDEARKAVGGAAAGGAAIGTVAGPIGTVTGGLSAGMGALSTTMELGFTTADLLKEAANEKLKERGGKQWDQMNDDERFAITKEILTNKESKQDITNRALKRGLTIGTIDALTGVFTGGAAGVVGKSVTKSVGKAVGRGAQVGAAAATETVGGLASEIGGQYAAGQEFDAREILTEGFADKTFTAIEVSKATANISPTKTLKDIVRKSVSIPNYKINGEIVTTEKFKETIKGMDDITFLATKIEVNNDPVMSKIIENRQRDISIDSQIDPKISDINDRSNLIKLERDLMLLKNNETKSASNKRNEINSKIKDITDKYKDVETDPIDVISRSVAIANAARTRVETEFNINAKKITEATKDVEGLDIKTFDTTEQVNDYLKQIKQENVKASEQQGFIIQRSDGTQEIILNKEQAVQDRAVTVAQHEFLHAVLFKTIKNNDATAINLGESLLFELDKIDASQVANSDFKKRLEQYKQDSKAIEMEEALTLFSDAVANGDIKFNESVFTKLQDLIRRTLQAAGVNVKFNTGRDVYNFIKDYNRSIKKTGKLTTAQQKVASEGAKGKLVEQGSKQDNDIVKESKIASDNVQNIYNEKGVDGAFEIIEQFNPIINKLVQRRSEAPNFNKQDLTDAIKYDDRGILGLIRSYDPKSKVPLAAYVNKFLPSRMIEASNKILGEEFTLDVTEAKGVTAQEAETTIDQPVIKKIKPSSLLKNKDLAVSKITEGVKNIDPKNLTFKKLKDLSPETTAEIFEVPVNKITNAAANLNKVDLSNAARNINKNADKLLRLLPEGAVVEAASEKLIGTSTGVPKSLLDVFYTKQDRLTKGAGLSPYKLNPTTRQEFLEALGIEDGKLKEGLSPRSSEAQRIKSIMSLTGKLITNEIVRSETDLSLETKQDIAAGKSRIMFSKVVEKGIERPLIELESGKITNSVFKNYKQNSIPTIKTKKDIPIVIDYIKKHIYPLLPKEAWFGPQGGTSFNKSPRLFNLSSSSPLWQEFTKEIKSTINLPTSNFGKSIKGKDGKAISFRNLNYNSYFKTKELIEKGLEDGSIDNFNYKVSIIHKELWSRINNSIKKAIKNKDKNAIPTIGLYLKAVGSDRLHWHKLGAQFVGYSNDLTSGVEMEHAMPATQAYLFLLDASLSNKDFDSAYNLVIDNYKLIALNKKDELKVSGKLKRKMPKGWRFGINFWFERYFNPLVAKNNKGIDPNTIIHINGNTFAQEYNVTEKGLNSDLANFNNKILPKEQQVKFSKSKPLNNKEVIDNLKNIDTQNKEQIKKETKAINLDKEFNDILENKTGIGSEKRYARAKAEVAGKDKGSFDYIGIPPSAQDFMGLLYKMVGKGKQGDAQLAWFKKNLLDPFAKAMVDISNTRVALANDFKQIKKIANIAPKVLKNKLPGEPFTVEQAIRVYIWNKQEMNIDGLSKVDLKTLTNYVKKDADLLSFANQLIQINKDMAYPKPDKNWLMGTMTTDLLQGLNTTTRKEALSQWQSNVDVIFNEANMNKLEAAFGKGYRSALNNMLQRMQTGRNRGYPGDQLTGRFVDWLNGSVGAIMFFNMRSAVLQTISSVNFINFTDNNPLKAAAAFANQPQFWKDVMFIMNSDYLIERRNGLKINVNEADIAEIAAESKNKAKAFVNKLLKLGFLPTQIADSFAIATGGASFYRNRVKSYIKKGLLEKEAQDKAFLDFREITEENQQSSRPDRISQQQAGPLGRIILAFANTPAQYARIIQRAASDLKNGRGDAKTNISKIIYYGAIQNVIFNAMQQALFAIAFGDEEPEDEKEAEKYGNIVNGMVDSLLRGTGFAGAAVSTVKNAIIKIAKDGNKQDVAIDLINISPPISSKIRKVRSAGRTFDWNKKEIKEKGLSLDNPAYMAIGQLVSATTNVPLDRGIRKLTNIKDALDTENEEWMRIANALGWAKWELEWEKDKKKKKKTKKYTQPKQTKQKSFKRKTFKRN